jgi:hypothetical protein
VFARPADVEAETLYVIGGLYGNVCALDAIEAMAAQESSPPQLVFNGDFHWFDADTTLFAEVQRRVLAHGALRGNVETEIAGEDGPAGCGCAYPESVPDDDVERSNAILRRLRSVANAAPGLRSQLATLAMHAVARVGDLRIAIVHGDAWSLAGWRFAHDQVDQQWERIDAARQLGGLDGFACSHTCAPALRAFDRCFVVNNGAAGMGNFAGSSAGVVTRIASLPLPEALDAKRLYGMYERDVWVDALRVDFDLATWLRRFDAMWPARSPAALSYRARLVDGPQFSIDAALGRVALDPMHCSLAGA